ncbi:MAG: GNAT family N-acetyltransferase [Armatimonas sp.]
MNPTFTIRTIGPEDITEALALQLADLATQLRGKEPIPVTVEWLTALVAFPMTWLLVAEAPETGAIGMLTLSALPRVTGWIPWIEGVVVDEAARGQGIGKALLEQAVELATAQGFDSVNLSSRPHREAANALYESLGFELVPTNYRRRYLR